jgi:two-component system phosphate regulon sensor histidine kinase PhoR
MHWDYWRLIAAVSLAGFLGLLIGHMMTLMFIAAFLYALWMINTWDRMYRWLQKPKKNPPPNADGYINDVRRQIDLFRQQNKSRKKRLGGYLKRFQTATSALPDGIVSLGPQGEVQWANDSATKLLGIYWPQDNGVRVNNLIRVPEFNQLLQSDKLSEGSNVITSPLDSHKFLEMKLVKYVGGGRLLIAREVTKNIKLQQMRRDFVANVSHELRTPLTVLRGYLETFTEDSPAEMWQSALPTMRQQTERMRILIKDLLALSQLETGEKPLNSINIDMPSMLTMIIDDAKCLEQFNDHQINLTLESQKTLYADSDEIHSVVSNIVFNAVKYTPAGTQIDVIWRENGKAGELAIIDAGDGIDERHLERLTERFYRVDKGRSQEAGGTGLGLAIVKHVLQRHNAELKISSELGKGCEFICCFPEGLLRLSN